jgi:hypothetical protein
LFPVKKKLDHPNSVECPKKRIKEIIDEFIAMSMPFKKRILLFSLHALFYIFLYSSFRHIWSEVEYISLLSYSLHSRFCVSDEVCEYIYIFESWNEHLRWIFYIPQTTIINLSILTSSIYHINKKKVINWQKSKKSIKIIIKNSCRLSWLFIRITIN